MAVYTYEITTDIIIPNIIVERKYADGVHTAYRITPADGYILHNPQLDDLVENPETGDSLVQRYYYREATIPARYAPSTWLWEAVLENDAPTYVIGGEGLTDIANE